MYQAKDILLLVGLHALYVNLKRNTEEFRKVTRKYGMTNDEFNIVMLVIANEILMYKINSSSPETILAFLNDK